MRALQCRVVGHGRSARRKQNGAVLVFTALSLPLLFGFIALVFDLGRVWENRRQLQNCADAAALAAAAKLPDTLAAGDDAHLYAREASTTGCLQAGDPDPTVNFLDTDGDLQTDAVEVVAERTLDLSFAAVIGRNRFPVAARAVAGKVIATQLRRLQPFGLQIDAGQACRGAVAQYTVNGTKLGVSSDPSGPPLVIHYDPGEPAGLAGNVQVLSFDADPPNASWFNDFMMLGYPNLVDTCRPAGSVPAQCSSRPPGHCVMTQAGIEARAAADEIQERLDLDPYAGSNAYRDMMLTDPPTGCNPPATRPATWTDCKHVMAIALAPPLQSGRTWMPVLAFAWFFVESVACVEDENGNCVSADITARLIDTTYRSMDPTSWGHDMGPSSLPSPAWSPFRSAPFGLRLLE